MKRLLWEMRVDRYYSSRDDVQLMVRSAPGRAGWGLYVKHPDDNGWTEAGLYASVLGAQKAAEGHSEQDSA